MTNSEPMWIEVTRGGRVESRHRIDVAVCTSSGELVDSFGDPARPTQPRSASKPIQALPLVTTGAAAAFDLTATELALACASHNSEPGHVDAVLALLRRVGSGPQELECGAHRPVNVDAADELIRHGIEPGPEHNNCSGKHSGFLTTAHHLGEDPTGYLSPDHPVQRRVTEAMEMMCGVSLAGQEPGVDGCGIPVWTMALHALATGWARLSDATAVSDEVGVAGQLLFDSMTAEPWYVAGTDRSCTRIMKERGPRVAVKGGAEGVYCGVDRAENLGIALKCADGAGRGAQMAIDAVLSRVLGESAPTPAPVHNAAGAVVGEIRAAGG